MNTDVNPADMYSMRFKAWVQMVRTWNAPGVKPKALKSYFQPLPLQAMKNLMVAAPQVRPAVVRVDSPEGYNTGQFVL
jgi:hypothetical protein